MNTAPAEMLQPHRRLSQLTDGPHTLQQQSFDMHTLRPVAPVIAGRRQLSQPEHIELDPTPRRRVWHTPWRPTPLTMTHSSHKPAGNPLADDEGT